MFYITYPSIKNGLRGNKFSIERVSKPLRRFAVIALVSTSIISFALIGCSAPGTTIKPSSSIYQHTIAREEGTTKSITERVPHRQEVESTKEKGVETGTFYASLPPPEIESPKLAERKEVGLGIMDFTPVINSEVEGYIKYFSDDRHRIFKKWLERYNRYGPMMRRILAAHGLPEDLVFVAMVESGFSPYAYSRSRAVGPWQFISGTGIRYGLTTNWWIDERNDPVKSTYAAARYLKDLYEMFGAWPLALAGYNAGEMRVKKGLEQTGLADFWGLARTSQLRQETKDYVPQIMAANIIAKNPEKYGFDDVNYMPRLVYEEVEINESTDLKTLAHMSGITYEELKDLNPELRKGMTPPNYPGYKLKIPYGYTYTFLANRKNIDANNRVAWQRHHVKRGETLFSISRKYGTSVDAVASLNKLNGRRTLLAGASILIPVAANEQAKKTLVADAKDGVTKTDTGVDSVTGAGNDKVRKVERSDTTLKPAVDKNKNETVKPEKVTEVAAAGRTRTPTTTKGVAASVSRASFERDKATSKGLVTYKGEQYRKVFHTVEKGHTLWRISRSYRVDLQELMQWNGLNVGQRIRPGDVLQILVALN